MAEGGERVVKVLCAVCGRAAVRNRVVCNNCEKWTHLCCVVKNDKQCCTNQDLDMVAIDEIITNNEIQIDTSNENQSFDESVQEALLWDNERLQEINEQLQFKVLVLQDEATNLRQKIKNRDVRGQNDKRQTDADELKFTICTMLDSIATQFDKNYVQMKKTVLDMKRYIVQKSHLGYSQKHCMRRENQAGKTYRTAVKTNNSDSGKNTTPDTKKRNNHTTVNDNSTSKAESANAKGAKTKIEWVPMTSGAPIPAFGQENFKCPDDFGFYPHHSSCDKYWKCDNNVAELKTCGNGLAFDAGDPKFLTENCDYIHNVDCGDRTQLEPPISTSHCERLYGIFADENKCDVFWNCWNGEASRYQCSPGLAYDREARVCMWADQVPECKNEEVAGGFSCPAPGEVSNTGTFSRHAHPDDCRKYYICLEGVPREYGCPIGTVFKIGDADGTGNCEDPEDVQGCEDYYGDLDLKSIRKSELLAGLQSSGSTRVAPGKSKPRPAPASRNAPEPADN